MLAAAAMAMAAAVTAAAAAAMAMAAAAMAMAAAAMDRRRRRSIRRWLFPGGAEQLTSAVDDRRGPAAHAAWNCGAR